jgi:hypothetical protein
MASLTPEQRDYKEKTLAQLLANLPRLESQLAQESRPEVANNIRSQLEDIKTHIQRLQNELATNTLGEPAADELFQRAAAALTKQKFYLAKRLISKLETIEPFYPGIDRLRQEAEAGRASRRTRAVAETGVTAPATSSTSAPAAFASPVEDETKVYPANEPEKKGLARFFQFHIVISCVLVLLILCVMMSVGGVLLLQWLVEGR